jgi:hypothetical protein
VKIAVSATVPLLAGLGALPISHGRRFEYRSFGGGPALTHVAPSQLYSSPRISQPCFAC